VFDGCEWLLLQLHMWSCHVGNMIDACDHDSRQSVDSLTTLTLTRPVSAVIIHVYQAFTDSGDVLYCFSDKYWCICVGYMSGRECTIIGTLAFICTHYLRQSLEYRLSDCMYNNKVVLVGEDSLQTDSRPKSAWSKSRRPFRLALLYIHQVNRVNNCFHHPHHHASPVFFIVA